MLKTALFAAAIATVSTAAPALAEAKKVPVFYGDLDLASAKGQETLARRLRYAAKKACDFNPDGRMPSRHAITCYREAHVKARAEMASLLEERRLGG